MVGTLPTHQSAAAAATYFFALEGAWGRRLQQGRFGLQIITVAVVGAFGVYYSAWRFERLGDGPAV